MNYAQDAEQREWHKNHAFYVQTLRGKNQDVLGEYCTPMFTVNVILIIIHIIIIIRTIPHPSI